MHAARADRCVDAAAELCEVWENPRLMLSASQECTPAARTATPSSPTECCEKEPFAMTSPGPTGLPSLARRQVAGSAAPGAKLTHTACMHEHAHAHRSPFLHDLSTSAILISRRTAAA